MPSEHTPWAHEWGYDRDCLACLDRCNCGDLVRRGVLPKCLHCRPEGSGRPDGQ